MVWATYVRKRTGEPWRLEAVSVVSPERARALAERHHARARIAGAELLVRQWESMGSVAWTLEPDAPAA
jgi:hypothetical protein